MDDGRYVVKPMALMKVLYGDSAIGSAQAGANFWTHDMEGECPESRIIEVIDDLWEGNDITPEMLYGPHFEWGDDCEVRDEDSHEWANRLFYSYTGRIDGYVIWASGFAWRQIRRITKQPEIEITLKVNGETKPLSAISKKTLLEIRKASK